MSTCMTSRFVLVTVLSRSLTRAALNVSASPYEKQTKAGWDQGVTEPGSSGSCLLFADGSYRLAGMVIAGPLANLGAALH